MEHSFVFLKQVQLVDRDTALVKLGVVELVFDL